MAPRTDRKLAAILAADVVGYSRLVGDDEAGTITRLKALRKAFIEPLIAEYHGRTVKLMGDGALVEFASAVDAVECAAVIQKGVAEREAALPENRRISFRIGINIGDIIVEESDILGDGVNVAARLEGLAEPGGICIARNVYNQVKAKLDLAFEPMGEHRVKNIAEPITVYRISLDVPDRAVNRRPDWAQRRWQAAEAGVVLLLALGVGGAWYGLWRPAPDATTAQGAVVAAAAAKPALPLPDKPSIAVLPFDNLSGDERYERLADGITEDIITDLSRFRDPFVIARNSTLVYKDKPTDVRQIARELGVQYVLEGSLQSDGKQVRVTAQLIDATSGNHVWSERYDRPLDDVFNIQGEVTRTIAASLAGQHGIVARAARETARRRPPEDLRAYELYLLGLEHKHKFTPEDNRKAQNLLEEAIEIAPTFARSHLALAMTHVIAIDNGWTDSLQGSMEAWHQAIEEAVQLDPLDGEAHLWLGMYYLYNNQIELSGGEHDKAVSLNPNNADLLIIAAGNLPYLGRVEQAVELADRAVRLNPHYPEWYNWGLMLAYFYADQHERALVATLSRTSPEMPDYIYRPLLYAELGRTRETAAAATDLLQRYPEYSAERWLSDTGTLSRDVELNRFLDSHRKAKLAICATEVQLAKYPDMTRLERCEQQRASG